MNCKIILSSLVLLAAKSIFAQDLVVNGSFENVDKKIKAPGQINLATGWTSPTATQADLISTEAKSDEVGAPDNKFGKEKPRTGETYAGIVAYSYKDKESRSYITSELVKPMTEGVEYCVRFNVSLSDLSKYSINNVSALLSDKPIDMQASTESILLKPQIQHSRNKIMSQQVYWEPICTKYIAKGGEQYITIGNFASTEATDDKKVKRPAGFTGAQFNTAYYYIDDVTIVPSTKDECICEKEVFEDEPEVIESTVTTSVTPDELKSNIEGMVVSFETGFSVLSDENKETLDQLADYMKLDSDIIIAIHGHISESEFKNAKSKPKNLLLGFNRSKAAYEYLISEKEVDRKRIKFEDVKNTQPVFTSDTDKKDAVNESVTFKAFGL